MSFSFLDVILNITLGRYLNVFMVSGEGGDNRPAGLLFKCTLYNVIYCNCNKITLHLPTL